MYVAKLNDLYLKKIDVENFYNGTKSINGQFTNSFRKAALFNDCDDEDVEILKRNGFKFYKLSETEVEE